MILMMVINSVYLCICTIIKVYTCIHIINFTYNAVPKFNFQTPNITIHEPDGPARICVIMNGMIGGAIRNITVTAQTGQKVGAENQATGIQTYQ